MDRAFRGVWIPAEVWLDDRLSPLDKMILMEVDSLDADERGCFASNTYLAKFCHCSERKVSEAISKLSGLGLIRQASFDGRTRILRSCLEKSARQTSKICEAENSTHYKRILDKRDSSSSSSAGAHETDFGAVMDYYLDRINPAPSTTCTGELECYVDDLSAPVVLHALEIAVDNKRTAWAYIRGILQSYSRSGLRTLEAVLEEEAGYRKNREKRGRKNDNGRGHGGAANRTPGATPGGEFDRRAFCVDLDGPDSG